MQKTILMIVAVVIGQSVLAADEVVITDPIIKKHLVLELEKPSGKFAPPVKFTKAELAKVVFFGGVSGQEWEVTNVGLKEVVAKLQNLTWLDLNHNKITDAGLKEVAKLQKLTHLFLSHTEITDASLKEVSKLQKLKVLHLNHTKITDAGLEELTKLQRLFSLHLEHTNITDAGLKHIAKMQSLINGQTVSLLEQLFSNRPRDLRSVLYLEHTKITRAGVAELKKALPKCRIISDFTKE